MKRLYACTLLNSDPSFSQQVLSDLKGRGGGVYHNPQPDLSSCLCFSNLLRIGMLYWGGGRGVEELCGRVEKEFLWKLLSINSCCIELTCIKLSEWMKICCYIIHFTEYITIKRNQSNSIAFSKEEKKNFYLRFIPVYNHINCFVW